MKIVGLSEGWTREVSCALDACDAINAYEQFLEVAHQNLPSFEMSGLFELIPGARTDPLYYIGGHREGEPCPRMRAS